ncbi:MAG: hypothetical protein EOP48_29505 [Sphingobacteriales bacterium]|nr:MAG: hypothetical protein EOP48_29505 [Sphingobacteriales bacterium]
MNKKYLDQMSFEALLKYEKLLNRTTPILIVSVAVIVICNAFLILQSGFSTFTVLPAVFIPMLYFQLVKLRRIKAEVENRRSAAISK